MISTNFVIGQGILGIVPWRIVYVHEGSLIAWMRYRWDIDVWPLKDAPGLNNKVN